MINFLLEQRGETTFFTQNELLRNGRNNPEGLARLFQLGIIQGQKDAAYINQAFFSWLSLSKPFNQNKLWEVQLKQVEHYLEFASPGASEISELKRALLNLQDLALDQAEQILLESDKQQALSFNEKVHMLRQNIIAASGNYSLADELQQLIWQSLQSLNSISVSLSDFLDQSHTSFHLKLKKIKQLKDQAKLNTDSELIQFLKEESSLCLEPILSNKSQVSLEQLRGSKISPLLKYVKKIGSSPRKESRQSKALLQLENKGSSIPSLLELKEEFEDSQKDLYSFLAEHESTSGNSDKRQKEFFFLLTQSFGSNWRWTKETVDSEKVNLPKVYAK